MPVGQQAQVVAYTSTGTLNAGCDFITYQSTDNGKTWTQVLGATWDVRLIIPDFANIPGDVAVGSDQCVYLSTNSGSPWQSLNDKITSSILFGLAVQGSTILTSAQDFSPISSFNGGTTWSQLEAGAAKGESGTVLFNPGNTDYAYFFTTSGFFYSTDGGKTFTNNGQLTYADFPQSSGNGDLIAVDVKNPSTVYVAGINGVYKSTDWGVAWTLESSWPITQPVMVAVDPTNSNKIFVGQQNGTLMTNKNGGTSWTGSTLNCSNCGAPVSMAVDSSDSNNILIGMSQPPPNGGVLTRADGGATFAPANTGLAVRGSVCQAAAVPHLRFDPSGSGLVAAATNSGIYTSPNLGESWTNISGNAIPYAFTDVVWSHGYLYASSCGQGVLRTPFSEWDALR